MPLEDRALPACQVQKSDDLDLCNSPYKPGAAQSPRRVGPPEPSAQRRSPGAMPAPALSKVDRVLYRTLQRLARTFDRHPALKVGCCRACRLAEAPVRAAKAPAYCRCARRAHLLHLPPLPPPARPDPARFPPLQALICRNLATPLPPALDSVVARFLGSSDALYYWPAPVGQPQARVADAVRQAFRQPVSLDEVHGCIMAPRPLIRLLPPSS